MSLADFARLGRLHPLVLHLPIGLLFGALVLEVAASRGRLARNALGTYLWFAALGAILAASTGWVLGQEDGYGGETLERHRRLGIAVAVATSLAALFHDASGRSLARLGLYRVALAAACVLLVPAGHLGSTMTHGADWLQGPKAPPKKIDDGVGLDPERLFEKAGEVFPSLSTDSPVEATPPAEPETYATAIAPFFQTYCVTCHGQKKRKGHLRLDSPAEITRGGESGPAFVPSDPAASSALARARLPLEHEDHMPPEGKPQPNSAELDALEAWIRAGAPFGSASAPASEPASGSEPKEEPQPSHAELSEPLAPAGAAPEALAALDAAFVHHEPLEPNKPELWVSVAAVAPSFTDAEFTRLLAPLAALVGELSLARSAITDATLGALGTFSALRRLDLRATGITSANLGGLPETLEELVLSQTRLSDSAVDALAALPNLRKLTVWSAGLSEEALARLRARPELTLIAGDELGGEPLESEGELTFTSDRPEPGAAAIPEALRPVNTTCPVSGSPVDAKYALVHTANGVTRVIGFCCPNCPKEFWADPEKFAAKLP